MTLKSLRMSAALLALAPAIIAFDADAAPKVETPNPVSALVASPAFAAASAKLDADFDHTVADIITLTEIPAPPFKEENKAKAFLEMLKAAGLSGASIDAVGNVVGVRAGTRTKGKGPFVVISAHLDTVFPEGTDTSVKRQGTKLLAPGVGDDSRGLATMLAYVRAMDAARIKTRSDILFVGTVGEEGPGNLRGVRYLFNDGAYKGKVKAFFSMDLPDPTHVVDRATGAKRYRITFRGPGGHSNGAFGIVNPMTAMAKSVVDLYAVQVPRNPKTTYAATIVGGGTSVNSIPTEVFVEFDLRSDSAPELAKLDAALLEIVKRAVDNENASRSTSVGKVTFQAEVTGDRPAGATAPNAEIVTLTDAAILALGLTPIHYAASTDANLPMSLGVPALAIGSGGRNGRGHALDEWTDVEKTAGVKGLQVGLAALLAVAGTN